MSSSVNFNSGDPLLNARVRHGLDGRRDGEIGSGGAPGGGAGVELWARTVEIDPPRTVEVDPLESVSVVPTAGSAAAGCLHVRLSMS